MFADPVYQYQDHEQQGQDSYLQDYKKFLQNKIKELDNRTNQVIFSLAEVFFQSSQRLKNEIYDKWVKVHSSNIVRIDILESQKSIELSIKLIHERQYSIVNHSRLVLEVQLPVGQDDRIGFNQQSKKIKNNDKTQSTLSSFQFNEESKVLNTECPICFKQMSNGSSYVKHMRLHDIEIQSQGYDCPHCEGSFSQCNLLLNHLYKLHYDVEDYRITKRKIYYCPFMKQKFSSHQSSQLSHFIRSSPHYTKAIDQILVDQLKPEQYQILDGQRVMTKSQNQPQLKTEFIRGVTKGIFVHDKLYGCPLCGLQEFETLKYLGGHIKNAHGVKYRNKLFCPHCQIEYKSARDLSTHLICIHGKIDETAGTRHQIYTALDGQNYGDFTKLIQHILNDENYLTFFNATCKSEAIAIECNVDINLSPPKDDIS